MSGVEVLPLGDVVQPTRLRVRPSDYPDLPFIGMEHVEAHSMKLLGTVPASTMKSSAVHFKPGDVLYGRLRPYLNKVYRPTFEGLCSAEFIVLPETKRIDGRYLQYFLNSSAFVRYASHLNTGDRPRVDFDQMAPYEIPLPEVNEQRHIVAEIEKQFSRLNEAVGNLKRIKANLKRYKAAILKDAVEGRLVPTEAHLARREGRKFETGSQLLERITSTGSKSIKATKAGRWIKESEVLQPLPEGWSVASIGRLAELVEYGSSAKTSESNVGIPVLRMGNIVDGDLDLTTLKYLPDSHEEFPRLLLRSGDVLFNRTNSPELVGKTAVFKGNPRRCSFASYLIRLRLPHGCLPEFVSAFINSIHGRHWVKTVATQQVGQANVNGTKLQSLIIPLPPTVEQERIVSEIQRRVSLVGHVEASVDAELRKGTILRQAVLRSQFRSQ